MLLRLQPADLHLADPNRLRYRPRYCGDRRPRRRVLVDEVSARLRRREMVGRYVGSVVVPERGSKSCETQL